MMFMTHRARLISNSADENAIAMQPLPLSSIQSARQMLTKHLPATRLMKALHLSELSGKTVSLKVETELPRNSVVAGRICSTMFLHGSMLHHW
jgi:hypothetical protein